ncbi:unnamed protein product [Notodromas monacha]|uniref:Uncharacterized protein n=1 Tax=Notodromas monacha TaxID=399045 RepID=A0A7R9BTM5_9CRUS|nr:unnamed protein product [Notodromas monacha]CAG0920466.1 unnamed protein product [Notodromas monacha]
MMARRRTFSEQTGNAIGFTLAWMRDRSKSVELTSPLVSEIQEIESDVYEHVRKSSVSGFSDVAQRTELYRNLSERLSRNLSLGNELGAKVETQIIPKLSRLPAEVSSKREKFDHVEQVLRLVKDIRGVVEGFEKLKVLNDDEKDPVALVETLCNCEDISETHMRSGILCCEILAKEASWWREEIRLTLIRAWKRNFCVTEEVSELGPFVCVKVGRPFESEVRDFITALNKAVLLDDCINWLASQTCTHLLNETMNLRRKVTERSDTMFSVRCITGDQEEEENGCNFVAALSPVVEALEFLFSNLLCEETAGVEIMQLFSSQVAPEFRRKVKDELLCAAVPSDLASLVQFTKLMEDFSELEDRLVKIGFYKDTISENAATRVEELYASKKRDEILGAGRELTKQRLRNTVTVMNAAGENMQVSENIVKIVDLLESTAQLAVDAAGKQPLVSATAAQTIRDVIEVYVTLTPVFHSEEFSSLPFLAAVVRNDAWFMSESLISAELFEAADLVEKLRNFGCDVFEAQLKSQCGSMRDNLRYDGGFCSFAEDPKRKGAELGLKRTITQMKGMHAVWSNCLPWKTYVAALGFLLDTAVEEILRQALTCEDIASEAANNYSSLLRSTFIARLPALFSTAERTVDNVHDVVTRLHALEEFVFVLDAHLPEIKTRWDAGRGPLARAFAAQEVKFLVRALFQNTDSRAKILAAIS